MWMMWYTNKIGCLQSFYDIYVGGKSSNSMILGFYRLGNTSFCDFTGFSMMWLSQAIYVVINPQIGRTQSGGTPQFVILQARGTCGCGGI